MSPPSNRRAKRDGLERGALVERCRAKRNRLEVAQVRWIVRGETRFGMRLPGRDGWTGDGSCLLASPYPLLLDHLHLVPLDLYSPWRSNPVPSYRTIANQQDPRPPRPSRRSPSRTPLSRPASLQTSPNRPRIQNPSSRSRSSRSPNLLLSPRKWLYDSHCRRYRTRETRFRKGNGLGYWYISFA